MPFCSYSCHLTVRLVPLKGLSVCLSLKQSSWSSIVMIPTHHWWSDLLSVNFWWIVSPYELTLSMSDGVHTSIEMTEYPGQHSEVMVYVYVWLKLCCKTRTETTVIDKWPEQTRYTWTERVRMLSPIAIFVRRRTGMLMLPSLRFQARCWRRSCMGGAEKGSCCRNGMSVVYDLNLDDIKWQAGGQTDRRLQSPLLDYATVRYYW